MTTRNAKKKTAANRNDALLGYRRSAKGLFDESKILDLKHEDEKTNCVYAWVWTWQGCTTLATLLRKAA